MKEYVQIEDLDSVDEVNNRLKGGAKLRHVYDKNGTARFIVAGIHSSLQAKSEEKDEANQ